jgi:hypothetical protein
VVDYTPDSAIFRLRQRRYWNILGSMFDEIPAPPRPPSQRAAIATFAAYFGISLVSLAIAWFRWSSPLPLRRKIGAGEFIVLGILSGLFLLTAKSVSPEANRKRMACLLVGIIVFGMTVSFFSK